MYYQEDIQQNVQQPITQPINYHNNKNIKNYKHTKDLSSLQISQVQRKFSLKSQQSTISCPLCADSCSQILISNALYHKHTSQQNFYYTKQIDEILDQIPSSTYIQHKQNQIKDQEQQFLRRFYKYQEYQYKNKAINQYYKFHKDYPKFYQPIQVDKILTKYYQRKKEYEYKKIKKVLKQEENISITTQKSSSMFSDLDQEEKKSRYSNMLDDLTVNNTQTDFMTQSNANYDNINDNQSQILKHICQKIQKAFKNHTFSPLFIKKKSIFDKSTQNNQTNDNKNFDNYLKKQKNHIKKDKNKLFVRSNKQSKNISIEPEFDVLNLNNNPKQYSSSGITNSLKSIERITKNIHSNNRNYNSKPIILAKNPFLNDHKLYTNTQNNKNNFLLHKSKNKQQNKNNLLQQLGNNNNNDIKSNYDTQLYKLNARGFKKIKQSSITNNSGSQRNIVQDNKNSQNTNLTRKISANQLNLKTNTKTIQRTTEQIYRYATNEMRKKSTSYNSLAFNSKSNRNSISNLHFNSNNKDKNFEIRNRSSSQKLLKQKNLLFNHQSNVNMAGQFTAKGKVQRSKSTNSFKTIHVAKFYDQHMTPNDNQKKKISIPKQIIKSLKGKSYSASKFTTYNIDKDKQQLNSNQKPPYKQPLKSMNANIYSHNLIKQGSSQNIKRSLNKNKQFFPISTNNVNIDNLLEKKLLMKTKTNSKHNNKFLI